MSDFDAFFVGDGSRDLMLEQQKHVLEPKVKDRPHVSLTGGTKDGPEFEVVDDIENYIGSRIDISGEDGYQDAFLIAKKEVYSKFDFLSIKSAALRGRAVREVDLILEDSDLHIIEYLKENLKDYYAVRSVAQLVAYEGMGIYDVMFRACDDCPMCLAAEGSFFYTRNLIRTFTSGGCVTHPYCDCSFFPIIRRSSYEGFLGPHLDIDSVTVKDTEVHNFPIEYNTDEFRQMLARLPFKKVSFVDMYDYRNTILSEKDVDSIVVHCNEKDETLYIHNDYVGTSGPFQYVSEYLRLTALPSKVLPENLKGLERYYLDGRTVVLWDGGYWDAATGERVK